MVLLGITVSNLFLLDESQKEFFELPDALVSILQSNFDATTILALHIISMAIVISYG